MPITLSGLFLGLKSYINKNNVEVKLICVSMADVIVPTGAVMPVLPGLGQPIVVNATCTLFDRKPIFKLAV